MADLQSKIEEIEEKLKQLKARQKKAEAMEKAKKSKQERADDTRRKILVGAVILEEIKAGRLPEDHLRIILDRELERDNDRALFDLPKKQESQAQQQPQAANA